MSDFENTSQIVHLFASFFSIFILFVLFSPFLKTFCRFFSVFLPFLKCPPLILARNRGYPKFPHPNPPPFSPQYQAQFKPNQTQFLSKSNAPGYPILNLLNAVFIYLYFSILYRLFITTSFSVEFLFLFLVFFSPSYILTPNKNMRLGPVEAFLSEIFKPSLLKLDFVTEIR